MEPCNGWFENLVAIHRIDRLLKREDFSKLMASEVLEQEFMLLRLNLLIEQLKYQESLLIELNTVQAKDLRQSALGLLG